MGRVIILLAAIFLAYSVYRHIQQQPIEQRKKLVVRYGFIGLIVVLVLLAATGRMHWLGAVIAAMIPLAKYLMTIAMRVLPFLQQLQRQKGAQTEQQHPPPSSSNSTMSRKEALDILGLQEGTNKNEIVDAHRRLIQKLHPDRGGNDYLAARVNQAKSVLLG